MATRVKLPQLAESQIMEQFIQVLAYVKEAPRGSGIGPGSRVLFWVYRDESVTAFYTSSGKSLVLANDKFSVIAIPNTTEFVNTTHGANYRVGTSVRALPCIGVVGKKMSKYVRELKM